MIMKNGIRHLVEAIVGPEKGRPLYVIHIKLTSVAAIKFGALRRLLKGDKQKRGRERCNVKR